MSQLWEKRIVNLIEKYKPSSDAGTFRNDYRDAVSDAIADPKIGTAGGKLLLAARDHLESWASEMPPAAAEAIAQLRTFYESAIGKLPVGVLEALLRRFPIFTEHQGTLDDFVLTCAEKRLIEALIDRRLVSEQQLNALARSHPKEFLQSAALDVLASRGAVKEGKVLWNECIAAKSRPGGLLSRDQMLIRCYSGIPGNKGDELLAALLLDETSVGIQLFDILLDDRTAATRFVTYLVDGAIRSSRGSERLRALLSRWLTRAVSVLEEQNELRSQTTSLLLGHVRMALLSAADGTKKPGLSELSAMAARATKQIALRVLRSHELGAGSTTSPVVVLLGEEIYPAVQQYLRELPTGAGGSDESPERALRHERYLGRKEVIEQVLHALYDAENGDAVRDALEVAMFNSGVRPIGVEGEEGTFDARLHVAQTPGLLPGDPIILVRPGQRLGDSDDALVLVKAKVRSA